MEYFALLGNVDRSILRVDFGSGYKVESMDVDDLIEFCNDNFVFSDAVNKVHDQWSCLPSYSERPSKKVYVVKKHLPDYPTYNESSGDLDSRIGNLLKEKVFEESISTYINHKLNLLRVLSHGDIKVAFEVFYLETEGEIETISACEYSKTSRNQMFSLFYSDYNLVNSFLTKHSIETLPKYIKFAVSNYEKSYFTNHNEFDFLALMIALETMFNDSKSELTLRVSRGCAVLLGKDEADASTLFKQVKQFYEKRSKLVHTGDVGSISETDVHELRFIVSRALFHVMELNLPKDELSTKLIMKGFGESW